MLRQQQLLHSLWMLYSVYRGPSSLSISIDVSTTFFSLYGFYHRTTLTHARPLRAVLLFHSLVFTFFSPFIFGLQYRLESRLCELSTVYCIVLAQRDSTHINAIQQLSEEFCLLLSSDSERRSDSPNKLISTMFDEEIKRSHKWRATTEWNTRPRNYRRKYYSLRQLSSKSLSLPHHISHQRANARIQFKTNIEIVRKFSHFMFHLND